jgi:hypothetical protein
VVYIIAVPIRGPSLPAGGDTEPANPAWG